MTDYTLDANHRRMRLEEKRRRLAEWLSASCLPASREFLLKRNRLQEIERELSALESEEGRHG